MYSKGSANYGHASRLYDPAAAPTPVIEIRVQSDEKIRMWGHTRI